MLRRTPILLIAVTLMLFCINVYAQSNYHIVASYKGENFSYVDGYGPLTTSNFISISVIYDVPRSEYDGYSFNNLEKYLSAWSMSDGIHTLDNTSSNISFFHSLALAIDANGSNFDVGQWQFHAQIANIRLGTPFINLYSVSGAISPTIGNDESISHDPNGGNNAYTTYGSAGGEWSVTVSPFPSLPPLKIITTRLPDAISGQSYSTTLIATGGQGAVKWSLSAGSTLPAGFHLDANTGILSSTGTPATTSGVYTFSIIATDSTKAISPPQQLSLTVLQPLIITSPNDNAHPRSFYVALTGTGTPGEQVDIVLDGSVTVSTTIDASGDWEKLAYTGEGNHTVSAVYTGTALMSNVIHTSNPPIGTLPLSRTPVDYTKLQKADIFLTRGFNSPQIAYYGIPTTGFNYTHTALYLGGDNDGTPMVAEAVTAEEGGIYGAVRSVPLEISTVWTDGTTVDIYRPISELSKSQRASIVSWAQSVTNKNIPYWSGGDFSIFYNAWNYWNPITDQPSNNFLFQQALKGLDNRKNATDRFICSTLVWHSYYAGTNKTVDLSLLNNATPKGVIGAFITNKLLQTLQPHFVFPDTLAQNGQLEKVN